MGAMPGQDNPGQGNPGQGNPGQGSSGNNSQPVRTPVWWQGWLRPEGRMSPALSGWLELLRGLAALAVLHGHGRNVFFEAGSSQAPLAGKVLLALAAFSHQAVIVFFVMSGWLVGGPLLTRTLRSGLQVQPYLVARFSRMLTVAIPALVLTLALDGSGILFSSYPQFFTTYYPFFPDWFSLTQNLSPSSFVCNALFLQTIACQQYGSNLSLWSLSNEFLYYILFLALVAAVARRSVAWGGLAVAVLVLFAVSGHPGDPLRPAFFFVYFLVWLTGVVAVSLDLRRVGSRWLLLVVLLAAAGELLIKLTVGGSLEKEEGFLLYDPLLGIQFATVLLLLERHSPTLRLLEGQVVRLLAGFSFSLYAVHLPVFLLLLSFLPQGRGRQPVTLLNSALYLLLLLLTCVVCLLFYMVFERRTPQVRRWLSAALARCAGTGSGRKDPPGGEHKIL